MRTDELKNWLAILGIGGGLAIAGADAASAEPLRPTASPPSKPPREERRQGPVYVVINHEEQYSIWPAGAKLPRGWKVLYEEIDLSGAVKRFPRIGDQRFRVVINHEEQYSIWPRDRRPPRGFAVPEPIKGREACRIDECGRIVDELGGGGP